MRKKKLGNRSTGLLRDDKDAKGASALLCQGKACLKAEVQTQALFPMISTVKVVVHGLHTLMADLLTI